MLKKLVIFYLPKSASERSLLGITSVTVTLEMIGVTAIAQLVTLHAYQKPLEVTRLVMFSS